MGSCSQKVEGIQQYWGFGGATEVHEPMPAWHVIAKSKLWSDPDHTSLVHTLNSPTLKPQVFA